jgi:hypothetical protein
LSDEQAAVAQFAWHDGLRRLREAGPLAGALLALVEAVHDELRRRVGLTFTIADLARVHSGAEDWFQELAPRVAPKHPDLWDPSVVLDGAFALYARGARDAQPA